MSEYFQSERRTVRGVALLEGEEPLLTLHSRNGLLPGPPPEEDDFLLLTNRRMMGRVSEGGRERYVIASLEDVETVEITTHARDSTALAMGILLVVAGLLAGALVYSFGAHILIALVVAATIAGLGLLTLSKYLFPEEPATVAFRTAASDVKLPLHSERAVYDALALASYFFQLKAGQHPAGSGQEAIVQQPATESAGGDRSPGATESVTPGAFAATEEGESADIWSPSWNVEAEASPDEGRGEGPG